MAKRTSKKLEQQTIQVAAAETVELINIELVVLESSFFGMESGDEYDFIVSPSKKGALMLEIYKFDVTHVPKWASLIYWASNIQDALDAIYKFARLH